ncbi:MAG: cupredoxin domain-containing protein [Thaumarchaeota archaeon]|nr:cupredoxin domain-containing protein [Nitrososphaerota archaeon]
MKRVLVAVIVAVIVVATAMVLAPSLLMPREVKQVIKEVNIIMADNSYKKYPDQEYFRPSEITVVIGVNNTVVWTNKDITGSALHDVTSDQDLFKSSLLAPNESWSYTFSEPGEYKYHCQPHEWMVGKVIVKKK